MVALSELAPNLPSGGCSVAVSSCSRTRWLIRGLALAFLGLLLSPPALAACPPSSTPAAHVFGGGLCLAVTTFGGERAGPSPTLLIFVHGDISDGGRATYHAAAARRLAAPGLIAVAITRPGYTNGEGRKSDGFNYGRSDNYTGENIAAVGAAVTALKAHYRARRVIYVGHSGGAAIGGVLIAQRPGLVDTAILVSCPCDIARWRAARKRAAWTRSLSPSDVAARVAASTEVIAITGTSDENTYPWLAEEYVKALARRGVSARFVPVADAGHGFGGLRDAVASEIRALLSRPGR